MCANSTVHSPASAPRSRPGGLLHLGPVALACPADWATWARSCSFLVCSNSFCTQPWEPRVRRRAGRGAAAPRPQPKGWRDILTFSLARCMNFSCMIFEESLLDIFSRGGPPGCPGRRPSHVPVPWQAATAAMSRDRRVLPSPGTQSNPSCVAATRQSEQGLLGNVRPAGAGSVVTSVSERMPGRTRRQSRASCNLTSESSASGARLTRANHTWLLPAWGTRVGVRGRLHLLAEVEGARERGTGVRSGAGRPGEQQGRPWRAQTLRACWTGWTPRGRSPRRTRGA